MDEGQNKPGQEQEVSGWQYKSNKGAVDGGSDLADATPSPAGDQAGSMVEWTASEFVAHEKGMGWYALLLFGGLVIATLIYLLTHDLFSPVAIMVFAVILAVAAGRKPAVQTYRLDRSGIIAGTKHHSYGEYKSFAITEEEPFASIVLIPMKRFGLPLNMYLAPDNQQQVLDVLSGHLPLERGGLDSFEKFMRKVRF